MGTPVRFTAEECGFDLDNMKPADWHAVCDIVRTAAAIQNADALDEQLAGFGELFQNLISTIEDSHQSHAA